MNMASEFCLEQLVEIMHCTVFWLITKP